LEFYVGNPTWIARRGGSSSLIEFYVGNPTWIAPQLERFAGQRPQPPALEAPTDGALPAATGSLHAARSGEAESTAFGGGRNHPFGYVEAPRAGAEGAEHWTVGATSVRSFEFVRDAQSTADRRH
jgi:hypothetical protein